MSVCWNFGPISSVHLDADGGGGSTPVAPGIHSLKNLKWQRSDAWNTWHLQKLPLSIRMIRIGGGAMAKIRSPEKVLPRLPQWLPQWLGRSLRHGGMAALLPQWLEQSSPGTGEVESELKQLKSKAAEWKAMYEAWKLLEIWEYQDG